MLIILNIDNHQICKKLLNKKMKRAWNILYFLVSIKTVN
jgi:hypothetical protein